MINMISNVLVNTVANPHFPLMNFIEWSNQWHTNWINTQINNKYKNSNIIVKINNMKLEVSDNPENITKRIMLIKNGHMSNAESIISAVYIMLYLIGMYRINLYLVIFFRWLHNKSEYDVIKKINIVRRLKILLNNN